jgi:hypothetical protein
MIRIRIARRRSALALLSALVAASLVGAALGRSLAPPRIDVLTLAPTGSGSSSHYLIGLRIDNPNEDPITGELKFTIRVPGQGVLTGGTGGIVIPALDRPTIEIEVDGDTLPSFSQLRAAADNDKLEYELFGAIILKGVKGRLPIQGRGALTLTAPPKN